MENCNMSVKEYWLSYNSLKCINIDAAFEEVTSTYMKKVWGNCGLSVYMISEDLTSAKDCK
jgi:hypothetical protein